MLRAHDFRLFYVGYTTSQFGTAMSAVAIAFAFLGTGGTATGLGVVFTANIVPMIVFLLVGGALADRLGRRRVMLTADLVRCVAQGTLAAALALGHAGLWLFVAAAFVVGAGNAFFSPALSAFPVQLAPPELLGDANALLGIAEPAAKVAGPALAGILIAVTSPALVIAVDAGSYAVSALALAGLRLRESSQRAVSRRNSLLRDVAEGWAEFTSHPWLWPQTVQFALFNLVTWGPYLVLGPVLADQYLGGARAWGVVLACYGGGAILGGLLALGRRLRRPLLVCTLTTFGFALPPLAFALRLPLPAVAGAALAAGLSTAFGGAFATTVEQRLISPEARSRVGAINMVGAFAFGPVAFIAAGPEAAAFGPRAVLAFGAAWSAAMTLGVLAFPAIRQLPWPEPATAEMMDSPPHGDVEDYPPSSGSGLPEAGGFAGFATPVTELLKQVDATFWWGLYDREPLAEWTKGRLALLGDAAHPMLPHLGQGANQAVEDSFALAAVLKDASAADVPAALHHYAEVRRRRTDIVQANSRSNGERYDTLNRTADNRDRELIDTRKLRAWLYDYDVEADPALAHPITPS